MITICQECYSVIKVDLRASGDPSHGLCKHCQPIYLRRNGVPEEDIKQLMEESNEKVNM